MDKTQKANMGLLAFFKTLMLKKDEDAALSVGKVISVVILIIIGLLMLPIVQDAVTSAEENATSDSAATLVSMITIFYILGVVLAAVLWVVAETRGFGGN